MADLRINVALAAIDKLSQPLGAARKASAGLASSIKTTQDNIRNLERSAKSFDRLSAQVRQTATDLQAAKDQAKKLREEFGPTAQRTDEQKKALNEQSKAIAILRKQQNAEVEKLKAVSVNMRSMGVTVITGSKATDQIKKKTEEYNKQLTEQEQRLTRVTAAQKSYDKAKEVQKKIGMTGIKMGAAGGAILWGGMRAMQPGMDFDKSYSKTLADAQLTRNSAEGQALHDQAKLLARTTHYNAVQATQGQDALISGGMTASNARQALPGVLNMALAANADLGQAANVGSSIFDAFQFRADQMDRVSDVLVATFTRSKTSLESLGETMKYVGPVARQAGLSLETTSTAAAMLAKNGIEGSMAGTGLKSVINGLYAPAKAGADALGDLHIKTVKANGAVRPLVEILQELYSKTRKFDQGSQLSIFKTLFGEEGLGSGQILAEAAAKGTFKDFEKYLAQAKGIAAKTSKTMTDNFDGDMQMLHSAWDGMWTQLEEGADSPMRGIVQRITEVVQGVTQWMQEHPKLTKVIFGTVLAMGALLTVAGTVLTAVAGLVGPLITLRLAFQLLAGAEGVGAVSASLGILTGAIRLVSIELVGLVVSLGLPVSLAIAAIAGIGVVLWNTWGSIEKWYSGFISRLDDSAKHAGGLKGALSQFALDFINAFNPVAEFLDSMDRKIDQLIHKSKDLPGAKDEQDPKKKAQQDRFKNWRTAFDGKYKGRMPTVPKAYGVNALDSSVPTIGAPPSKPEFGTAHWGGAVTPAGTNAAAAANTGRLGDIVFKNLPGYIPMSGGYAEPRVTMSARGGMSSLFGDRDKPAPITSSVGTAVSGDLHVELHIHDAGHMNEQQLMQAIKRELADVVNKQGRQSRSNFKDKD